jgi:hypothetical protein
MINKLRIESEIDAAETKDQIGDLYIGSYLIVPIIWHRTRVQMDEGRTNLEVFRWPNSIKQ